MRRIHYRGRRRLTTAEEVLTATAPRLRAKSGVFSPPYDPWRIAALLQIPVRDAPMSETGVDGFVEYVNDRPAIVLNGDARHTRRRFTLGHEIGHALLMLRSQQSGGLRLGLDRYADGKTPAVGSSSDPIEEKLCDRFAAELLMPVTDVQDYWRNRPLTAEAIRSCASLFEVPLYTACRRTLQIKSGINLSLWQRFPWPMTDWDRGISIPPAAWPPLTEYVDMAFRTRSAPRAPEELARFDLTAEAAFCGGNRLLLLVTRAAIAATRGADASTASTRGW